MGGASVSVGVAPMTQEEMAAAKIDMVYRDECARLLVPLNECRRRSLYLPWKCVSEREAFELCQYKLYKSRCEAVSGPAPAAKH